MEADGSDFQDFAFVTEEDVRRVHGDANFGNQKHSNFPVQLHYLLSEMERDGHSEVASWHSHGRSFAVHDKKRFEDEFLPNWFRQNKFESFQRQLNTYNFVRISYGRDKGGFCNELFLKGKPFLAKYIKRRKKHEQGPSKIVPNLYAFPPIGSRPSNSTPTVVPGIRSTIIADLQRQQQLQSQQQQQQVQLDTTALQNLLAAQQHQQQQLNPLASAALVFREQQMRSLLSPQDPASLLHVYNQDLVQQLQLQRLQQQQLAAQRLQQQQIVPASLSTVLQQQYVPAPGPIIREEEEQKGNEDCKPAPRKGGRM